MRETVINGTTVLEEIQSYEHNIGAYIRIVVGVGKVVNNKFEFDVPQQYQTFIVIDKPEQVSLMTGEVTSPAKPYYSNLLNAGAGNITTTALWQAVDILRYETQPLIA